MFGSSIVTVVCVRHKTQKALECHSSARSGEEGTMVQSSVKT